MYFGRYDPPTEADDLTNMEWKLIKQLALLLDSAEASSLDMCKDDSHLRLQIAIAHMLQKELVEADVPDLVAEKKLLQANVEDRFGGLEKNGIFVYDLPFGIYGLALFLDPRFKDRRVANSAEFRRQIKNWIVSQYQPFSSEFEEEPEVLESSQEEPFAKKPRSLFAREKVTEVELLPTPNSWMENLASEIVSYNTEKTLPLNEDPLLYWQKDVIRSSISFSAVNIRGQ